MFSVLARNILWYLKLRAKNYTHKAVRGLSPKLTSSERTTNERGGRGRGGSGWKGREAG